MRLNYENITSKAFIEIEDGTVRLLCTWIPDATCHRKYWDEFDADELIAAMEDKYKDVPGLEIPAEYDTYY